MPKPRFFWIVIWAWVGALGCGEEPRRQTNAATVAARVDVEGPVVARVDGEPVSLKDVQQTVTATGLSPSDALARIEAEALLADYAQRNGYGTSDERAVTQARVRALLRESVERGTSPGDIPAADVRARFESVRAQRERPEGRSVVHVLFRVADPSHEARARTLADELMDELRRLPFAEVRRVMEAYERKSSRDGISIIREQISDARQDGTLAEPFVRAVFRADVPQLVKDVVHTSFGYHVIAVLSATPAVKLSFGEAESAIRQTLSSEARAKALDELVTKLRQIDKVRYDEEAIRKALAEDEILGVGP